MTRFNTITNLLSIACISLSVYLPATLADFNPVHPYLYMDEEDITVMKDNVLTQQYPWAVQLYNDAKQSSRSGSWNYSTFKLGKDMMGCAMVYLIDGNTSYADGAVYWLNKCKTNFNPQDQTLYAGYSLEKRYHFQPIQVTIPIVYDLMYNYMAANRPNDLAELTTYVEWLRTKFKGSFGHNENHQNLYAKGLCALAIGDSTTANSVSAAFMDWYNESGQVHDGFHYEPGNQGHKHFAYVIESQIHYINAAHRASERNYTNWDPVTWTSDAGKNLIKDNWRFLMKKATPKFQVPYESMWRGNNYYTPKTSGIHNIAFAITGNNEWQALNLENPDRDVINHHTVNTYWAGLSHGREITGTPRFKNDSVINREIGKAIVLSGDPNGYTDPASALHAYLLYGQYGESGMNLKIYGKGKKLNASPLTSPTDSYGERGEGGSYVLPGPGSTGGMASTNEIVWDVTDSLIKVMAFENDGHHRSVAITDDYFIDVYDVSESGLVTWDFHGLGPSNSTISNSGNSINYNITATWPNHMKSFIINDVATEISMTTMSGVPWMTSGITNRLVNPIYTTEQIRRLRLRRRDIVGSTRFISLTEPLENGGSILSVERFNTSNTGNVTGLKISAENYTDYYFYNDGSSSQSLTKDQEQVNLDGKWGFIRKSNNGSIIVKGNISWHNIDGTPSELPANPTELRFDLIAEP